ncbi:MAG: UDP-N-acetylmuramate dehydrogenase [Oligoflexales bacterium]|nr:UDP-N-acetylmuramate dehydrogenase [Oligoflexales bacterium]
MDCKSSLKKLSYYKTGGPYEQLYAPSDIHELKQALEAITAAKTPFFLLGAGTNSLVMDTPYEGAVISFHKMTQITMLDHGIRCRAGVSNTLIAETAHQHSLAGAAWMNYLPGQIGATVRMNARCYGGEISHIVTGIKSFTPRGQLKEYRIKTHDRSVFRAYKDTIFMNNNEVIAEVELSLQRGNADDIRSKMDFCRSDRESKSQFTFPSCGCVFKNDYSPEVSISSGMLLEHAGAKGLIRDHCRVSADHANFIFNTNDASSREILELSMDMRDLVWDEFGVWLEYEMELLGTVPPDLKSRLEEKRVAKYKTSRLDELRAIFKGKQGSK